MKVLQFTIPVAHDQSIIVQEDVLPHFYPYLHRHYEAQLMWILEGEGTLLAGTNMHAFKAGDVFLLGANQPHLFKSSPEYFQADKPLQVHSLMVFFDPHDKLYPIFNMPEIQPLYTFIQQYAGGFKIPLAYAEQTRERMLDIRGSKNTDQIIHFLQLLQTLYGLKDLVPLSAASLDKVSESEGVRISNIYNYAMQHFDKVITLEQIAAEANMTPEAFCRYFKKHTGNTFITFINQLRVNEACKKLTSGKIEGIATVAYSCGFNSITNFNRIFKAVSGCSPRQYLDNYHGALK
ncbi:MAG: AraC family transcriptional regulator [Bacteroidota bacterium]